MKRANEGRRVSGDSFVGLKSTDREIRAKRIWGFDTEDDSKGNLKQICATDGVSYHRFTKRQAFIDWLISSFKEPVVFVACNLEYDLINVFIDDFSLLDLRLKNGGLSIASARLKGSRITFYDTLNHFPASVAQLGDALGLPKLKMDLTGWDYVDRDALIVQRYCAEMQERYNALGASFNSTLPSSSLDLYRRVYLPFAIKRPPDSILDRLFQAYYGGRTEVFNVAPQTGRIFYIDVNSLYPFVMQREFPNPNHYRVTSKPDLDGFGVAYCKVRVPDLYFPPLPHRGDKLLFPVGEFEGAWSYPELRAAIARGCEIKRIIWAIEYPDTCFPFLTFVRDLYAARMKAKNPLENQAAKLFMNSLYGKFGERVDLVRIVSADEVPPDKTAIQYGEYAAVSYGTKYPNHTNAIFSIYTTSYARIHLLEALETIRESGGTVLYCDTDSVIYKAAKPLHRESKELGGWKLEGKFSFGHFLAPKLYSLATKEETKIRAKGVPKEARVRFFNEGTATFSRPLRLRSILKKGLKGNLWIETQKSRLTGYTKRRALASGDTAPLRLGSARAISARRGKKGP